MSAHKKIMGSETQNRFYVDDSQKSSHLRTHTSHLHALSMSHWFTILAILFVAKWLDRLLSMHSVCIPERFINMTAFNHTLLRYKYPVQANGASFHSMHQKRTARFHVKWLEWSEEFAQHFTQCLIVSFLRIETSHAPQRLNCHLLFWRKMGKSVWYVEIEKAASLSDVELTGSTTDFG